MSTYVNVQSVNSSICGLGAKYKLGKAVIAWHAVLLMPELSIPALNVISKKAWMNYLVRAFRLTISTVNENQYIR